MLNHKLNLNLKLWLKLPHEHHLNLNNKLVFETNLAKPTTLHHNYNLSTLELFFS